MIETTRFHQWRLRSIVLIVTILMLMAATGIQAQSPALCNDWNFVEDAQIRAEFGEYRYQANCKFINPRNTGILLPFEEVTQIVNVFYPEHDVPFPNGGVLCLRSNNELLFTTGPNQPVQKLDLYRVPAWPQYICSTLYETGYVLRTRNPSNVPSIRPPPPPIPQSACTVTTTDRLRLRLATDRTSRILGVLPANLALISDQRVQISGEWWYHIPGSPVSAEPGWLNGNYLTFDGDCGFVCAQDPTGTRIQCRIR